MTFNEVILRFIATFPNKSQLFKHLAISWQMLLYSIHSIKLVQQNFRAIRQSERHSQSSETKMSVEASDTDEKKRAKSVSKNKSSDVTDPFLNSFAKLSDIEQKMKLIDLKLDKNCHKLLVRQKVLDKQLTALPPKPPKLQSTNYELSDIDQKLKMIDKKLDINTEKLSFGQPDVNKQLQGTALAQQQTCKRPKIELSEIDQKLKTIDRELEKNCHKLSFGNPVVRNQLDIDKPPKHLKTKRPKAELSDIVQKLRLIDQKLDMNTQKLSFGQPDVDKQSQGTALTQPHTCQRPDTELSEIDQKLKLIDQELEKNCHKLLVGQSVRQSDVDKQLRVKQLQAVKLSQQDVQRYFLDHHTEEWDLLILM